MKKILVVSILFCSFFSCVIKRPVQMENCKYIIKNGYQNITENKILLVLEKDSLILTEIKYECTFRSFYTGEIMFKNFGEWNTILSDNKNNHIMIWNDIQLFENETKKFNIATKGIESKESISSSIIIYDNNNDLLSEKSMYRTKLINYFSNNIKSIKSADEFYNAYWKAIDYKRWETIQFNRNIKKMIDKKN